MRDKKQITDRIKMLKEEIVRDQAWLHSKNSSEVMKSITAQSINEYTLMVELLEWVLEGKKI